MAKTYHEKTVLRKKRGRLSWIDCEGELPSRLIDELGRKGIEVFYAETLKLYNQIHTDNPIQFSAGLMLHIRQHHFQEELADVVREFSRRELPETKMAFITNEARERASYNGRKVFSYSASVDDLVSYFGLVSNGPLPI